MIGLIGCERDKVQEMGTSHVTSDTHFGVSGTGVDVTWYSGTSGDVMLWDASDAALEITGTAGQDALNIADGNLTVVDDASITGAFDVDTTGAITLDADTASHFNVSAADLTLEAETKSVIIKGDEAAGDAIHLDANETGGGIDIDTGSAGLDVDAEGAIALDADLASNFNTAAGDITIESEVASVTIKGDEADQAAIYLDADETGAGIDIDVGSLGVDVDLTTAGPFAIDGDMLNVGNAGVDGDVADGDNDLLVAGDGEFDGTLRADGPVDMNSTVDISRTTTANEYGDLITAEWTAGADMTGGGSNGIYASSNPIEDVQNAYALRGRMDMRGAGEAVAVNQLHAIDVLVNVNETQTYTVDDNISAVGAAIHGGTSGGMLSNMGGSSATLNLLYGEWGPTATEDFDVQTNGLFFKTHNDTVVDYGINIESSSNMDAGLFLNSHASNSGAKMDVGVEMTSGASDMVNGINMEDASFTGADIVLDHGETIDNNTDGTIAMTGDVSISGLTTLAAEVKNFMAPSLITKDITWTIGAGGTHTLATVPDGEIWIILNCYANVTTDWDATAGDDATFDVGDTADPDGILDLDDAELQKADTDVANGPAGWQGYGVDTIGAYMAAGAGYIIAPSGAADTIDVAWGATGDDLEAGELTLYLLYIRIK